jgi:ornithine carbamoyltransferase
MNQQIDLVGKPLVEGKKHDVLGILDVADRIDVIIANAIGLKRKLGKNGTLDVAKGRTLGLLFEKSSTRTRLSFEVGFRKLGGIVLYLNKNDIQLGRGETIRDTACVFNRMLDVVMYRAFRNQDVAELAAHTTIPVINGLDDVEHPCQALADMMTLVEHFGQTRGLQFVYVGDAANNVARSYLFAVPLLGMDLTLLAPEGYRPDPAALAKARAIAAERGCTITVDDYAPDKLSRADVVATDTWISMGDEADEAKRLAAFDGYTITPQVMAHAPKTAVFLHCLPAHYGQEVTEDVVHGPQSLVFDEAENRMWAQMALVLDVLGLQTGIGPTASVSPNGRAP